MPPFHVHLVCFLFVVTAISCNDSSPQQRRTEIDRPPAGPSNKPPSTTTGQKLASVIETYQEQTRRFRRNQHSESASDDKNRGNEAETATLPQPEIYAQQLIDIMNRNPKGPENIDAVHWILTEVNSGPTRDATIQLLQTDYFETEQIANVLPVLVDGYPDKNSMQLIEKLATNSRHHRVRAVATMARVKGQQALTRFVGFLENPKWTERMKTFVDKPTLEYYQAAVKQEFDMESTLQELIDNYGQHDFGIKTNGRPVEQIGPMATDMLFSLQHLQIGKSAPKLEGQDLDGLTFSLAEYRGKIVMLDFWGDW